ncbi:MAG: hypothetical protein WD065_13590, partial [Planctomycetaceae bacterium]
LTASMAKSQLSGFHRCDERLDLERKDRIGCTFARKNRYNREAVDTSSRHRLLTRPLPPRLTHHPGD